MNSPIARWLLVIIWMSVIFAFSHQANSSEKTAVVFGGFNIFARKMGHISEFAILYFWVRWALLSTGLKAAHAAQSNSKRWQNVIEDKTILVAILISIAYAASDEWHQSFVPGRSACIEDVLLDSVGIVATAFLIITLENHKSKR